MKKILASLIIAATLTFSWSATPITYDLWFTWKANPVHESVTSYVIEKATLPSTNFVSVVTVSGTTNVGVVRGLTPGTYMFRVYAKNGVGSSLPSNVLNYPTNPPTPMLEFKYTTPK
jgi:hypothetical protein